MTAVPDNAPLTIPDVGTTAAMPVSEEVHNPPVVASISVGVAPEHIDNVTVVMAAGKGLIVTVA